MINRVSKYGILIVALSFTTYFLFELLSGLRIHAAQYALLGASLTLFPLLLVSLAETLDFTLGYGAAASMVLAQASGFTVAVTRRWLASAGFAALLAGLFGFLFVLLRLETYALLSGSLALFAALSAVMVLTRRVDWWGERA
jgi:inner membrane protein